jgi:RNA polymerase sigma factor (sigma-70 family)
MATHASPVAKCLRERLGHCVFGSLRLLGRQQDGPVDGVLAEPIEGGEVRVWLLCGHTVLTHEAHDFAYLQIRACRCGSLNTLADGHRPLIGGGPDAEPRKHVGEPRHISHLNKRASQTVWNDVIGAVPRAEVRMARAAGESVDWPERDEAFKVLVGPRLDRAYGLAWHFLGHAADAEDACQEALLAAWSAWPRLRDPDRFDAWFDRILVNTCIEHLRRRGRRPRATSLGEPDIAAGDLLAGSLELDAVGRAIGRLSPDHRAVIVLRYWADLETDAISARLGVPPGTVRSRLHYALGALRADLERERRSR